MQSSNITNTKAVVGFRADFLGPATFNSELISDRGNTKKAWCLFGKFCGVAIRTNKEPLISFVKLGRVTLSLDCTVRMICISIRKVTNSG